MKKLNKSHPADAIDTKAIEGAQLFTATLFLGTGKFDRAEGPTLAKVRALGQAMEAKANNGRKAVIHAYATEGGKAILVPASFGKAKANGSAPEAVPAKAKAAKAKAPAVAKDSAKGAKVKAKARAKAPAKAKAKAKAGTRDGSKTATVIAMLRKGKHTRAEIVEATGWGVDINALAARKGLKIKRTAEGILTATGGE